MNIGYLNREYPYLRNVIDCVPDARYTEVGNLFRTPHRLLKAASRVHLLPRSNPLLFDMNFRFREHRDTRVDLIHLLNSVSFGRIPWVTTFETVLPRYRATLNAHHGEQPDYDTVSTPRAMREAFKQISSERCKAAIAMSECNSWMQSALLDRYPDFSAAIRRKTVVLHPPQPKMIEAFDAKPSLSPASALQLLFVGSSFFRKGGREILQALEELRRHGADIELTIVSSLLIDAYATKETAADVQAAIGFMQDNKHWIRHHPQLDNTAVLQLMRESHVGLLPTHAETYGYSVLEFQASGCPVISTDIRALPEINNDEVGWMIQVPKNRFGEALYETGEQRADLSSQIRDGLVRTIESALNHRRSIADKGERALQRVAREHDPIRYADRLRRLYEGNVTNPGASRMQ